MIKRSESKTKFSSRRRSDQAKKKRRLMMEGLEDRRLLAADVFLPDVDVETFNAPRNVGAVQSLQFFESETVGQSGTNDTFVNADLVPLGNGPGQSDTIDLTGSMSFDTFPNDPFRFEVDLDTFAFDLKAGDILDISALGTAGTIDMSYADGRQWFFVDNNAAAFYPPDSPLQTIGNAVGAQVVPEDGRYFLTVSPIDTSSSYTLGLRTYRPIIEQYPVGAQQVIFLDFDGGFVPSNLVNTADPLAPGLLRIPSLQESLPILGIDEFDTDALNELIDRAVESVKFHFDTVAQNGDNGDFNSTGIPGQYGVKVLNSRDHADPGNHPLVTRIVAGGDLATLQATVGVPVNGVSSTLDVGNFSMDDTVLTVLEGVFLEASGFPISASASLLEATAVRFAVTLSHEAAHSFGMNHTNNVNNVASIIDTGGSLIATAQRLGVGPDGIFGTLDDEPIEFKDDRWDPAANPGYNGVQRTVNALAYTLATGTQGNGISGRVFRDANGDGQGGNDAGLPGVTVFADVNGNGVLDPSEQSVTTDASGNFSLQIGTSTAPIIAIAPEGFSATTPTSLSATSNLVFGFRQDIANANGRAFIDNNGNGFPDVADAGLEDVYVYIDLDGDNRPDLFEPSAKTNSDGTYNLNFPEAGTYTIRAVTPPGFELSFPASGEHTVFFDGTSLDGDFDFGLLPSQDFGDAPNTGQNRYGTLLSEDGPRHGIIDNENSRLVLGDSVDRDLNGQPTPGADGDDLDFGGDDEDGIRQLDPLGPGASADFGITVTNTAGQAAYLKAFIDFNGDGDFDDTGESLPELTIDNETVDEEFIVTVNAPATAIPGSTIARVRLSQTSGLGPRGFATAGEVEDHVVVILNEAEVANDDERDVPRNALSFPLDVLENDFQTPDNELLISFLTTRETPRGPGDDRPALDQDTRGVVSISREPATDGKLVFYTPPNGFIGRDEFLYTVVDEFGNESTAKVVVNVKFQSEFPIAVDDSLEVPEGSVNRALNVLDNDVPSLAGGVSIIRVSAGSAGGRLRIDGGGQSIRYTPLAGFDGTEQFTYSVQDSAGSVSTATVTVDLLPGSRTENPLDPNFDKIDFEIEVLDEVNRLPVSNVKVGDEFFVRVKVNDRREDVDPRGVASAFLDLLYTDELVSTVATDLTDPNANPGADPNFPFWIKFGPLYDGGLLRGGNAQVPGLIDEVGASQGFGDILNPPEEPTEDETELFTLKMRALSPGVAVFKGDPADEPASETVLLRSNEALVPRELRLGREELLIIPDSDNFLSAIDDSFPDGRDSNGQLISSNSPPHVLRVLENDNFGPTNAIRDFGLVTNPTMGSITNLNRLATDQFLVYQPDGGVNGLERFTYFIESADGVVSTAEVTIALGNQNTTADVAYDFRIVSDDESRTPLDRDEIGRGQRIGLEIRAEDLTSSPTFVFAGFLDVLYDSDVVRPSNQILTDSFDFDVEFGDDYLMAPDNAATAVRPGIIDELGTVFRGLTNSGNNPALLATVFFDVIGSGTDIKFVGSPADARPFSDTLLFNQDEVVEIPDIRYDVVEFDVAGTQQNFALREDVNNDGNVTPLDALMLINDLARGAALEGEQVSAGNGNANYYPDVNGDDHISAVDALLVINYLQRQAVAPPSAAEQVVQAGSEPSSDEAVGLLSEEDDAKLVDAGIANDAASNGMIAAPDTTENGSKEDEDDVLDLLADDVAGIWA